MIDVKIDYELCEGHQVCRDVCEEDVFEWRSGKMVVANTEKCTECWLCVQNCPTAAVSLEG